MNLLIVESPAKAKTIQGYLGSLPDEWTVLATGGHIIDLPTSRHGIKHEAERFIPEWEIIDKKKEVLKKIKAAAQKATHCFIGSDDDREGETIAASIIKYAKIQDPIRITFTEITQTAIIAAIESGSRPVDGARVSAQEARRLVDREIGYPVSQIIRWSFKKNSSEYETKGVGRIISPALHLLSETEKTIEAFIPTPYSIIYADYNYDGQQFRLTNRHKFTEEQEHELEQTLAHFQNNDHYIYNYQRKTHDVTPYPPLITSRLQRCAFYLFGMEPKQTMKVAQQLYEGVLIGDSRKGLITYPRTDSYSLSDEACAQIINVLSEHYENEFVQSVPRKYKNKENAQAAHEAIRPTAFSQEHYPKAVKPFLTEEQYQIYRLIWGRTLSCQMTNAVYDRSIIEVDVAGNKLLAQANTCLFSGWEVLDGNQANVSEQNEEERHKTREVLLPSVMIGDKIEPMSIEALSLSTKCPPRFGMGRFITLLDNKGIARPSTIDGILPSLQKKGYVTARQGMLYVTKLGSQIDAWTTEHAYWLSDVDMARQFEQELDNIEQNNSKRDQLIATYVEKINGLKKQLGFVGIEQRPPTEEQIKYASSLATKKSITIPPHVLENQLLLSKFIKEHTPEVHKMGKCPECKGDVIETEKSYRCKQKECTFYMVRSQVSRFINQFQLDATETVFAKALFMRKKNGCENMPGKKGKRFNAYIGLSKNEKFGWQPHIISFSKCIENPIFRGR